MKTLLNFAAGNLVGTAGIVLGGCVVASILPQAIPVIIIGAAILRD